jgi:flavodoxin
MSARTLVAYDALSDHAREIANEIRDATGARLEEICEPGTRRGFAGVIGVLFGAVVRRTASILSARNNPADYDLLLIGGPVWAGRMPAPVRAYAQRFGTSATRVAFFCTEGQRGADSAFADLETLCRHPAEATLVVDAASLPAVEHHVALDRFASGLSARRRIESQASSDQATVSRACLDAWWSRAASHSAGRNRGVGAVRSARSRGPT